ncbi:MAG: ABC transporter ATP-binding protein [Bacilli bacterium]
MNKRMQKEAPKKNMKRKKKEAGIMKKNFIMLKYVYKFCPTLVIWALLKVVASAVIAVAEVKLIKDAIDNVINSGDISVLYRALIIYAIVIVICYFFVSFYNRFIYPKYQLIYAKKMNIYIYQKVRTIDMEAYDDPEFFDKFRRGLRVSRFRGMTAFTSFMDFLEGVVAMLALGAYVIINDLWLVLFVLVGSAITIFCINIENTVNYRMWHDTMNQFRYQRYVNRTFYDDHYADEIKTTPVKHILKDKYLESAKDKLHIYYHLEKKLIFPYIFRAFGVYIIEQALSYIYLGYKLLNGYGIDTFTAIANAIIIFIQKTSLAITAITSLRNNALYIDDFIWLLRYKPKVELRQGENVNRVDNIKINNLYFKYPGVSKNTINGINLNIKRGQKIAIVGDNGGGKTTLMKLLMQFYYPTSGDIDINGEDSRNFNEDSIRNIIGIVFQDFQIYAMSVAENILMRKVTSKDDEEIVMDALKQVGLYDKIMSTKNGIYTEVTKEFTADGVNFSGGESQKMVIARVFASDADTYILDEPTASLDPFSEVEINKLILEKSQGKTIVIIAHRLSSVVDADKIYLIRDGRIHEQGTHEELMKNKDVYYEMFATQRKLYVKNED